MRETTIQNNIRAALNTGNTRAWRNNIGTATLRGAKVRFGLPGPGGSDLIGIHSMTIMPRHVGRKVAVFTAIECKSAKGRTRKNQETFIDFIRDMGGIAGVTRSAEEAKDLIYEYEK